MTTSDLERRLAVVLRKHAEDAMNDTRTEEKLETLLDENERRDRRRRRLGWGAGALVAAAATAGIIAWGAVDPEADRAEPAAPPQPSQAEEVAAAFADAFASSDVARADSYVADSAFVEILEGWSRARSWNAATGFQYLLRGPCDAGAPGALGTPVRCPFDYHALRSDELGRGPYTGSAFIVTVSFGEVVAADEDLVFIENGFSAQMWEPFSEWVTRTHPKDAAVMYTDYPDNSMQAVTDQAIALWERHTKGYVKQEQGR